MGARTISFVKGRGNVRHNNREFTTENVDEERTCNNITYVKMPLEDAYKKCFGKAVEDYNAKQKRKDRKIDSYLDQIRQSKNGEKLFYENVVQIGDKYDTQVGSGSDEKAKEVLDQYAKDFQKRNPNLYVFNMVMHLDEQTPHLHIDYIPVANTYERGLQTRNSLDKALKEQGIEGKSSRKENATQNWQERERDYIKALCKERELETVKLGVKRKNLSISEYKVLARTMEKEIEQAKPYEMEEKTPLLDKSKVIVNKTDLDQLKNVTRIEEAYNHSMERGLRKINKLSTKLDKELAEVETLKKDLKRQLEIQVNLNKDYNDLKVRHQSLSKQYTDLLISVNKAKDKGNPLALEVQELKQEKEQITKVLNSTCERLANETKALSLLKYDKTGEYKTELSPKADKLLEGNRHYAIKWLKQLGKDELAKDVETHTGISKGIQNRIDELTPKRTISWSHDR